MNSKIINRGRYKKVTRRDIKKRNRIIDKNIKSGNVVLDEDFSYTSNMNKVPKKMKSKFKGIKISNEDINEYKSVTFLMFRIFACIFAIFLISVISILFTNKESNIVTVFGNNDEKIDVDINYNLKLGVKDLNLEKNICINELNKYSKGKLLTIDDNYKIKYVLIDKVEKITDTAYIIKLKDSKYIDKIVDSLILFKSLNISKVEKIDDFNISIIIKEKNPYFVYYLSNINIDIENPKYFNYDLNYKRNDKINNKILESISILQYDNSDNLVNDFINRKVDLFLTSSDEELRGISSCAYNLRKYRDGETYFLFFNRNNEVLKNREIRKAIESSLNKKEIANKLNFNFYEPIDIPYLYSKNYSKYDKIGSENIIIKNSYIKKNGIYYKKNKPLIFKLIVNKNSEVKCKIADEVKEMLSDIGIRVNVIKCDDLEMKNNVINNNYDLMLATVNLNENPDISFLYDYINIDNILKDEIDNFDMSLNENIIKIQNKIREEVLCVGITAKTASLVYGKDINGFDNISYNNIFYNIENIGIIK